MLLPLVSFSLTFGNVYMKRFWDESWILGVGTLQFIEKNPHSVFMSQSLIIDLGGFKKESGIDVKTGGSSFLGSRTPCPYVCSLFHTVAEPLVTRRTVCM